MKKFPFILTAMLSMLLLFGPVAPLGAQANRTVHVARLEGVINPATASYVGRVIEDAGQANAHALVIELDTPGGLMTSMRAITTSILNSPVPVVVYVAPQGARAASAGLWLTMAAHVAAMAPNTNIGSAHPVTLGEGQQMDDALTAKVVNDAVAQVRDLAERRGRNADWAESAVRESANVNSAEALRLNVIDLLADDLDALLKQIDGREVTLVTGQTITLQTDGAATQRNEMNFIEWFLYAISEPTIAYILLILGINAILYELSAPGTIVSGVTGVILLLLAFYALGTLPINLAGVLLIVLGFGLLVAEIVFPGFGVFGISGIISLLLGSVILMQSAPAYMAISPVAIAAVVLFTAAFFFIAIRGIVKSRQGQVTTGTEGMIGAIGQARTDLNPTGTVLVQGERWEAVCEQGEVLAGERVRVVAVEGFRLKVTPASKK